jgi:hypothetical protein
MIIKNNMDQVAARLSALQAEMPRAINAMLGEVSSEFESELKSRALSWQVDPEGVAIKANAPGTIARKQKLGHLHQGRVKSLWDTGAMMSARWRGEPRGGMVFIRLPEKYRGETWDRLTAKGYRWFGIPVAVDGRPTGEYLRTVIGRWWRKLVAKRWRDARKLAAKNES